MSNHGPVVVVVMSHKDPPMVRRLVQRVLQGDRTVVLSHHDPRGPHLDLPATDRVMSMPGPRPCTWGRLDLALALLRCVEVAAERVPDLSWVLAVSGQDYPCRPMPRIEAELAASPYDGYLNWVRVDGPSPPGREQWHATLQRRYLRSVRVPGSARDVPLPRTSPAGRSAGLYAAGAWVNLGAAAVAHVLEQRALRQRLVRQLRWSSIPDEALMPTLLLNDAQHLHIANDRKRWLRWQARSPHPRLLEPGDVPDVLASTDFFARKVDSAGTAEVLDLLDRGQTTRAVR